MAKNLSAFGFIHIETGDIVRSLYQQANESVAFGEWAKKHNAKNPDFFNKAILQEIEMLESKQVGQFGRGHKGVVITGNHQYDGIEFLKKNVHKKDEAADMVLYLEAPLEELFKRQTKRGDRAIPNLDMEKFKEYIAFDEKMGIAFYI